MPRHSNHHRRQHLRRTSSSSSSWKGDTAELYPVVQDLTAEEYQGLASCCCPTVSSSSESGSEGSFHEFIEGASAGFSSLPCNWFVQSLNKTEEEQGEGDDMATLEQARKSQPLLDRRNSSVSGESEGAVASPYERSFDTLYVLTQQIFRNGASQVWKCVDRTTGHRYCVKIMEPRRLFIDNDDDPVSGEIEILRTLQPHTNVVEFIEVVKEKSRTCLVTELLTGGNLLSLVVQQEGLSEKVARPILQSVLHGLVHLHATGVWHNDLQASNILLDQGNDNSNRSSSDRHRYRAKIADFGHATWSGYMDLYRGGAGALSSSGRPRNSISYTAPELLFHGRSTAASDMWSVGVLMYFTLFAKLPFSDEHGRPELSRMERAEYVFPSFAPGSPPVPAIVSPLCPGPHHEQLETASSSSSTQGVPVSRAAKQLMSNLIHTDSSVRLTASEALEHPWFQQQDDEVEDLQVRLSSIRLSDNHEDTKARSISKPRKTKKRKQRRATRLSRDRIGSLARRLVGGRQQPSRSKQQPEHEWKGHSTQQLRPVPS